MKIFVDAMGGDYAPQAPVEGAIEALRRYPEIEVVLAGVIPESRSTWSTAMTCAPASPCWMRRRSSPMRNPP